MKHAVAAGVVHGLLVIVVWLGILVAVPSYAELYSELSSSLPGTTRAVIEFGYGCSSMSLLLIPLSFAAVAGDVFATRHVAKSNSRIAVIWIVAVAAVLVVALVIGWAALVSPIFQLSEAISAVHS